MPVTPPQPDLRTLLDNARITGRALAEWMGYRSDATIARMTAGKRAIPDDLRAWLLRRAADPPPTIRE